MSCQVKYFIFYLALVICASCNTPTSKKSGSIKPKINSVAKPDTIRIANSSGTQFIDSTIILKGLFNNNLDNLDSALAKKIVCRYFKKQGYLTEDELAQLKYENGSEGTDNYEINYDTCYLVHLNKPSCTFAVVLYWLLPAYGSSCRYELSKSIIVHNKNRYILRDENFIPDYFNIDSITYKNDLTFMYCNDAECGKETPIKNYRLTIKGE